MAIAESKVQRFLLQSVVPVLCSVLIGFVFYGDRLFDRHYGAFQFLWSSVVASLFYYLLRYRKQREAFAGLIFLFFLTLLTTHSTSPAFLLRDVFYVGAIGASVFAYFRYFAGNGARSPAYPPFLLAGIYGVTYPVFSEIHLIMIRGLAMDSTGGNAISVASAAAFFGVLIGFGVGAGIAINEKLNSLPGVHPSP
jgi:hypothetical protein